MSTQAHQPDAPAPGHGVPRVFSISSLVPRANCPTSRSARVVNAELTGAEHLFSGIFWSDPGSTSGWSFGSLDPKAKGCPHLGIGEEVYLCLSGRIAVEWQGGSFEFGAGDIVYWPNNQWYRTRVISDVPAQVFYAMAPQPAWIWSVGDKVTQAGDPAE
jgi:mannose-6-phosphate isomerase-like protein (cupin superfamily)